MRCRQSVEEEPFRPQSEQASLAQLLAQDESSDGMVDQHTHHTELPVLIAQVENGVFVVRKQFAPVIGDPYMSQSRSELREIGPGLQVVS